MFEDNLKEIMNNLKNYKRDKNHLLEQYIEDRLNLSVQTYYKELNQSYIYLNNRKEINVLKKITK